MIYRKHKATRATRATNPENTLESAKNCAFPPPILPGECTARKILQDAAECVKNRGQERDKQNGERSMRRTVEAFNALTGHRLTIVHGWLFMVVLKAARATAGKHRLDDFLDGAAYFALAGEEAECESEN